jgi:hypothetical protein
MLWWWGLHRTGITRPLHLHRISSLHQMASVGQWPWLNNAAPSLQLHYRAFITHADWRTMPNGLVFPEIHREWLVIASA